MESAREEAASGCNREGESTDAAHRGGAARSSDEGPVMELERRGCVVQPGLRANRHEGSVLSARREEPVDQAKPFSIAKREAGSLQACEGQPGSGWSGRTIDCGVRGQPFGEPLQALELPVLRELLSSAGASRRDSESEWWTWPLGIPTVADRIAQEVVRRALEPILEPVFHPDSYGYRPGKSAIDAARPKPASAAGARTGCSISTSRPSSTASTGS